MNEEKWKPGKPISYGRQSVSQADIDALDDVLKSDWLTGGPKVQAFEEALARFCGARHCIVTANGTAALHIATLALDIGPGDIGLTSPITFMASANCILFCGGKPAFADIDPETLCLSPEAVDSYCRKYGPPKVVIPVDFAGVPADLPAFKELSRKYGFKIIEDAAHALGSTYTFKDEEFPCGSCRHSDLAIFSFHPVKTITTGEGGAVLTNDDGLAKRVRMLANHGIERAPERWVGFPDMPKEAFPEYYGPWYHEMHFPGYNYRLSDIHCALGLSQLSRLKEFKSRRQDLARQYNTALSQLVASGSVRLPPWPRNTDPCFHLYALQFEEGPSRRKKVFMGLRDHNIFAQVHYIPVHLQPYYRKNFGFERGDFPHAEAYYERAISLPLYPDLKNREVDGVVDAIAELVKED